MRKNGFFRKIVYFKCAVLAGLLIFTNVTSAQAATENEKGRILFISSYSYGWDTVQIQIEGIKAGVNGQAVLDYEFMDTKRVNDETSAQQFYEGLKYRLSKVEPYDVVILGDDAALLFAVEHQDDLFAGIPLVLEGVNDIDMAMEVSEDPMITGVVEKLSVEKNIEFGRVLYPNATRVVAILDSSITGQAERKSFYSHAAKYPDLIFDEIDTSSLTTDELKQAISQVGEDSILIYIVMTEDASGKQYTNEESVKLIAEHANVPAMRMVEGGIGQGLLGGNVVSMHLSGEIAAQLAMEIINGKPAEELAVVAESPNVYCVDELVMKKFGLSMDLVPEGAEIVNHEPDFWERNEEVLLPAGTFIAFLLVVISWVVYDNFRRRKLMIELEEAHEIMESAAMHDFLTGIPNRSKFMTDLNELIEEQIPCSLMMLDIDGFKQINDTHGHAAGDEALQQLADRLKAMKSPILQPYRYAGDEFIVLIKSAQPQILEKAAVQCHQLFDKPFKLAGKSNPVSGSIGLASYPSDADTAEMLIARADEAMYHVKKSGKNNYGFYKDYKNE